jgi:hypothetical protein
MSNLAPLDDPRYQPAHPPLDGRIPEVVVKWGPKSQVRWFRRYAAEVGAQPIAVWARHYCVSEHHRGQCCYSCDDDPVTRGLFPDGCCCLDERV